MRKLMLCLGLLFSTFALGETTSDITGQWQGVLKIPNKDLRIIVKIIKDDNRLQSTLYSIDQQAPPLKGSGTRFESGTLTFAVDPIGGKYEASSAVTARPSPAHGLRAQRPCL